MKILVDMDGILVNTMPEFLARFNRRTGSHYHMSDLAVPLDKDPRARIHVVTNWTSLLK